MICPTTGIECQQFTQAVESSEELRSLALCTIDGVANYVAEVCGDGSAQEVKVQTQCGLTLALAAMEGSL